MAMPPSTERCSTPASCSLTPARFLRDNRGFKRVMCRSCVAVSKEQIKLRGFVPRSIMTRSPHDAKANRCDGAKGFDSWRLCVKKLEIYPATAPGRLRPTIHVICSRQVFDRQPKRFEQGDLVRRRPAGHATGE